MATPGEACTYTFGIGRRTRSEAVAKEYRNESSVARTRPP